MSTISYNQFTSVPISLQPQLITILEAAQIFVDTHLPNSFPNEIQTKYGSKRLKRSIGFPNALFKFEYLDIVLSLNTVLPKHIDSKNDNRQGYNHCTVYSFYQVVDELEYKVSIIMATRLTVGAAFAKAHKRWNKYRHKFDCESRNETKSLQTHFVLYCTFSNKRTWNYFTINHLPQKTWRIN